jgi:putative membrane protein
VGEQKTAYVLIDGNNLKAGLRQAMLEAVEGAVDDAEVLTTDNHAVNKTMGADDEVGSRGDNTPLVDEVAAAVKEAADDLRPSSVAWASGSVSDVRVFGPGLTVKMSATINSAVSVMIPTYIACMCAALLGCGLLALVGV